MSEFIEVRCGAYRFLIPSEDIASIEFLDSRLDPLPRRRVPRAPLLLDGRALAGNRRAERIERGVALRLSWDNRVEARVIVDQAGTLIRLAPDAFEPLPRAVAGLRPFFVGVWRNASLKQYLFCLRPRHQLPIGGFAWLRRIRRAALTGAFSGESPPRTERGAGTGSREENAKEHETRAFRSD
jgi:hypothetical protein